MSTVTDHPLRYDLANELHARPFPPLKPPQSISYLVIKQPKDAAGRDRGIDRDHLIELLNRHGAPHPKPGATHYFGKLGDHLLKWESHTEIVTYTLFRQGSEKDPFDGSTLKLLPEDWLAKVPGHRVASALVRLEELDDQRKIDERLNDWFVSESLVASRALEGNAIIAGDFRIDATGQTRFAVFVQSHSNPRKLGRLVQLLLEIETYKSMSMLGFARVGELSESIGRTDRELTRLLEGMAGNQMDPDLTLKALLAVSSDLENLVAQNSFRFGATRAYEAIVQQRIEALRESGFEDQQTIADFMSRRFDPAMRTVKSAETRLSKMAERALRAGDLLRTQVDVERSAQNQKLLQSMDRRADLQLRLQRTVEGLSVVAISYYAVNLAVNILAPFASDLGLSKIALTAITTPVIILGVWYLIRQIRKQVT